MTDERLSDEVLADYATGAWDNTMKLAARELIERRKWDAYLRHMSICLVNFGSNRCDCGFDAMPEWMRGGK